MPGLQKSVMENSQSQEGGLTMFPCEIEEHKAIEANLQNVGLIPNAGGVYFLCNKGEIIYIGTSSNLRVRICSHMSTKEIDRAFFLIYEGRERLHYEKQFIRQYKPKLNCFRTPRSLGNKHHKKRMRDGEKSLTTGNLAKIADALGKNTDDFFVEARP
jgi:hypothetical protein